MKAALVTLLAAGLFLVSQDACLAIKARLARVLITRCLERHLEDGSVHRPWSWADFHPVARLEVPNRGMEQPVLSGAAGESLAFGLGHIDGTADPGEQGNCVLAGHRDSWAGFMKDLAHGDRLVLVTAGTKTCYEVTHLEVVHDQDLRPLAPHDEMQLTLLTCWPLSGLRDTELRYVVYCRAVE